MNTDRVKGSRERKKMEARDAIREMVGNVIHGDAQGEEGAPNLELMTTPTRNSNTHGFCFL